jgi:hypothetical protein
MDRLNQKWACGGLKAVSFFIGDVDFYGHCREMLLNSKMLKVFSRRNEEGNENHRSRGSNEGAARNDLGRESVLGGNA